MQQPVVARYLISYHTIYNKVIQFFIYFHLWHSILYYFLAAPAVPLLSDGFIPIKLLWWCKLLFIPLCLDYLHCAISESRYNHKGVRVPLENHAVLSKESCGPLKGIYKFRYITNLNLELPWSMWQWQRQQWRGLPARAIRRLCSVHYALYNVGWFSQRQIKSDVKS